MKLKFKKLNKFAKAPEKAHDSEYRGEIKMRFSVDEGPTAYMMGNKVGQILFLKLPKIDLVESTDLTESDRSEGGFGSTGE